MRTIKSFSTLLNYFGFIDEGILLNKDGSLSGSFYFGGLDLDSSLAEKRNSVCTHINSTLAKLQTGWMINVDAMRVPVTHYLQKTRFSNSTMEFLERERTSYFEQNDVFFETIHVLTLTFSPLLSQQTKFSKVFVTKDSAVSSKDLDDILLEFNKSVNEIISGFSSAGILMKKASSQEMFDFLHYCIRGKKLNIKLPNPPVYLDHALSYDFLGGMHPQIDQDYVGIVSLFGFPLESQSMILHQLTSLAFEYRFSTRFSLLDNTEACAVLKKILVKHHNKQFDIKGMVLSILSPGSESQYGNIDTLNKADDTHQAITEAQEGLVKYGYYTSSIVVIHNDKQECLARLNRIVEVLNSNGFTARTETFNAIESYLGSFPSSKRNIRQPLIHTLNLSHLLPLSDVWSGFEFNPNPRFPKESPALFRAITTGMTPINGNIHVNDVGTTLILGPIGSGKTTLLSLISKSFFRYKEAQVFQFDVNNSQYVFSKACGAIHYDLLGVESSLVSLCPLKDINKSAEELSWAAIWLEETLILQGVKIGAQERSTIRNALEALRLDQKKTLSNLYLNIQDSVICEALEPFVSIHNGSMSQLLDGDEDDISDHHFLNFEIKKLLDRGSKYSLPVLSYLFHRVDQRLDGRPTLIILEEVWRLMDDEFFCKIFSEWLRLLRAKNGSVVFAVHNISDLVNSSLKSIILDSCKTKIFLPNTEAGTEMGSVLYEQVGLNDEEISIIATAIPKKEYYYTTPYGRRLMDLALGDGFLRFVGRDSEKDKQCIWELEKKYGNLWIFNWLQEVGLNKEATAWKKIYQDFNQKTGDGYEKN